MSIKSWFTRLVKENPAIRPILAILGAGTVVWTGEDYYKLILAGYKYGTPVYGCTKLIAKSAAGIDWLVYKRASDGSLTEVEGHELVRRLARPNPRQGRSQFMEEIVSDFLLAGNVYLYRNGIGQQPPKELWPLRPDRTRILAGKWPDLVGGYRYEVSGGKVDYKPEEVLHVREFNPLDDFYGLSRLVVASKAIDIYNWSREWNLKMLQNDMRPSLALLFARAMTKDQRAELKSDLRAKYQGAENAREPLILEGSASGETKVQTLSMTPADTDWQNSDKANLRQIFSIFGVASELLGDSENKTYSNIQEARKALYDETVLPLMDMFRDELNNWFTPLYRDNLVLDYNRDAIEALQEDRGKKYAYLTASDFLKVNEKRQAVGYEEVPEGDVILVSMSAVPLPAAGEADEEPDEEPEDEDDEAAKAAALSAGPAAGQSGGGSVRRQGPRAGKSFWQAPERKVRLWLSFVKRLEAGERGMVPALEKYLKAQAREVRDKVGAAGSVADA